MSTPRPIGVLSSRISAVEEPESLDDVVGPEVPETPYELTAMLTGEVQDELMRAWGPDWLTHLR
jgi:hypothetical protein